MPLQEIFLDVSKGTLPQPVSELINEADKRCDDFFEAKRNIKLSRYIPSDSEQVFNALRIVTELELPMGKVFCEWGSGFGVATCLASLLGYRAIGIEIQSELVEISNKLSSDLKIPIETICRSYVPDGYETYEAIGGTELIRPDSMSLKSESIDEQPEYEELEIGLDEIDLFYVYPWPGEQEFMQKLFDEVAAEGAILICYYADKDVCVYRKVFDD